MSEKQPNTGDLEQQGQQESPASNEDVSLLPTFFGILLGVAVAFPIICMLFQLLHEASRSYIFI
jgi:uncharacterized membrane protein YhaH (DUF805 family)